MKAIIEIDELDNLIADYKLEWGRLSGKEFTHVSGILKGLRQVKSLCTPVESKPEALPLDAEQAAKEFANEYLEERDGVQDIEPILLQDGFLAGVLYASAEKWIPVTPTAMPPKDKRILAIIRDEIRLVSYGKVNHVPIYGWSCVDGDPEDMDCADGMTHWMPLPEIPKP